MYQDIYIHIYIYIYTHICIYIHMKIYIYIQFSAAGDPLLLVEAREPLQEELPVAKLAR